jgi:signal transduction histidine kinase
MVLARGNSRTATLLRLIGLGLITLSIFNSKVAPATSGRGLVVLLAFVPAFAAWLVWTFWSSRQTYMTPDMYVMAICGGIIQMASQSSAASTFTFVAAMATAARVGLLQGLVVAALGAAAVGAGAIAYDHSALSVLAYSLGFAAVTLGGANIRQSRMRLEQAELLLAQTQRSHEEQLRAARLEESARIARDIHDVLAHTLAGLVIQLEATDALLAQGVDALSIRERVQRAHALAREGLQETRRAVGALRGDAADPAPTLIRALIEQYESPIEFTLTGDESRLDGQAGEAAVRVIQEALTNVRKHAAGADVTVALVIQDDSLDVTVENRVLVPVAPSSLAASGGGYGLRGMRERAAQLGGTLAAGPTSDGWRVELHLPLNPGTSTG